MILRLLRRRRVAVVGIMRVSLLFGRDAPFRNARAPLEERATRLFDRNRLEKRLALFEALAAPSLAAQDDDDFSMIFATSRDLPGWALARLKEAARSAPYRAEIVLLEPDAAFGAEMRRAARAAVKGRFEMAATFRLDDDDALASDFIATLKRDAATPGAPLISYASGRFISADGLGGLMLREVSRPMIACGLARVTPPRPFRTIHSTATAHHKLREEMEARIDDAAPMWLVSAHGLTDSARRLDPEVSGGVTYDAPDATRLIGARFAGVDLAAAARALAAAG